MNRKALIIVVVLVLSGGAALAWWLAHRMPSSAMAATGATDGRRVLYWHDPMKPDVKFDKPGKSPFMDMQLVPVYADDAEGAASVRVNPAMAQSLGIRIGKVEAVVMRPQLRAVGTVAFDESRLTLVQSRVAGYVTHLRVRAPLQAVKRGEPLADIVSPDWVAAQEEYLALLNAQSERGRAIRDAARARLVILGMPEDTIRAIESEHRTRASTPVFAPIDGVVTELSAREGTSFMPGAPLFRINGLQSVWVNAQVPEAQVSMIAAGSEVQASATAWPGVRFTGRIAAILPDVDPQTRTLTVRVALQNPKGQLAPGMFMSLQFAAPAAGPQLAVASEALIMTGERSVVIVAREGGSFDVADVTVGAEVDGKTAILKGLSAGQSVVLSGQFLIDSEASLRSTVSRLTEAGGETGKSEAATAHRSRGHITAITGDAVTIAHEAVPSMRWPAMTMTFMKPSGELPAGLKVGDAVTFSFSEMQGGYRIETLMREAEKQP
jgi:Cu(I)/Ag(I) efflux system membrane fusion protein